jgi:hypothetical protein
VRLPRLHRHAQVEARRGVGEPPAAVVEVQPVRAPLDGEGHVEVAIAVDVDERGAKGVEVGRGGDVRRRHVAEERRRGRRAAGRVDRRRSMPRVP